MNWCNVILNLIRPKWRLFGIFGRHCLKQLAKVNFPEKRLGSYYWLMLTAAFSTDTLWLGLCSALAYSKVLLDAFPHKCVNAMGETVRKGTLRLPPSRKVSMEKGDQQLLAIKEAVHNFITSSLTSGKKINWGRMRLWAVTDWNIFVINWKMYLKRFMNLQNSENNLQYTILSMFKNVYLK